MAYDADATVAFDCPGHQGGQFYRKSRPDSCYFKHFGENIAFRNDLCNADVDLGDLLIHEGAAVGGTAAACGARIRRRPYLFRSERNQHFQQGRRECGPAPGRPRAVRPQQSRIPASGRPGTGRRDPGLSADRAQCVWHDRGGRLGRLGRSLIARADPRQPTAEGQGAGPRGAPVPAGLHPARHLRRHDLQREEGDGEDRSPVRVHSVG